MKELDKRARSTIMKLEQLCAEAQHLLFCLTSGEKGTELKAEWVLSEDKEVWRHKDIGHVSLGMQGWDWFPVAHDHAVHGPFRTAREAITKAEAVCGISMKLMESLGQ